MLWKIETGKRVGFYIFIQTYGFSVVCEKIYMLNEFQKIYMIPKLRAEYFLSALLDRIIDTNTSVSCKPILITATQVFCLDFSFIEMIINKIYYVKRE